jgi:hypothetical protein
MSGYAVIKDVGETLRELLKAGMRGDSVLAPIIDIETLVTLEGPPSLIKDTQPEVNHLSVFLYRVIEDGDMKNRRPERVDANMLKPPPLSLDLFYLLTPLTSKPENDHLLLGKAMQILYDNCVVKGSSLQGVLGDTAEELRIILNPISIEDISKIWSAFMRPYHLSVSYEVKVVYVDSQGEQAGEPVRRKELEFEQYSSADD